DFRSAGTNTFTWASNLYSLYAKTWGAGGGGFSASIGGTTRTSVGGGGGFSGAALNKISATSLPGTSLDVVVGGAGTGSLTYTSGTPGYGNGAGGGGASGVRLASSTVGLVAGGGGGGSFS